VVPTFPRRQTDGAGLGEVHDAPVPPQLTHYRPIQPRTAVDVTQDDLVAQGAIVTGLESTDVAGVDPVFARPTIDHTEREPELAFADVAFPVYPLNLTTYQAPDRQRQNLVVLPGHLGYHRDIGQLAYDPDRSARLLDAAAFFSPLSGGLRCSGHYRHREPFVLGPFTVTPFLNDHSAYDAYSLLVEAGGRRLFYTGDIRGHGRKAAIFEELLRKPPGDVDVLLMEGTNIQPGLPDKPTITETDVEQALIDQFRATAGLALVVTSAQNIDRLVTIYRAALQADRDLVVDAYTADVARATGNDNIPRPDPGWPRIHTYLPRWQAIRIKNAAQFDRLGHINPYRLFPEHLATTPSRYVLLFSTSE
jgi:ribonuclease J